MKKIWRKLKLALITFGLLFAALLSVPLWVDIDDIKDDLTQLVLEKTGIDVAIGDVELSVFPWVGFTLQDVKVKNASGFKAEYLLAVQTIDIQLALMPLLDQRIEVKRFELHSPHLWLEQQLDGKQNWVFEAAPTKVLKDETAASSSTAKVAATETPATTPAAMQAEAKLEQGLDMTFNADLLLLSNGLVSWTDDSYGHVTLSDIQLAVRDLQLENPISITLSARLGQGELGSNTFVLQADVGPLQDLQHLNLKTLPVALQLSSQALSLAPLAAWLPALPQAQQTQFGALQDATLAMNISLEQHASGQVLSSGQLALNMKHKLSADWKLSVKAMDTLHIEGLSVAMDEVVLLSTSGEVKHLQSKPSYEIKLATSALQRLWLNQFVPELAVLYQAHPKPWKSIKLDALIAGDTSLVDVRNLQLQLDDEAVQISGNVVLGKAPDIQLRVSSNGLHVDPWLPQSKQTKATPAAVVNTPTQPPAEPQVLPQAIEPDLRFLKPWYVSLQVNIQTLHVMNLQLDALRLTLSAEKGMIRLNPLRFDIGDGQVSEHFTLNTKQYPVTWQESVRMTGVQVLPILEAVAELDMLSGVTQLNADFTGKGLLPATILKHLKGNGQFVFEDGQIKGLNIAQEMRKLQQKTADKQQNATDFAQMQGSFNIKNGVLYNKDLYMATPLFRLTGKGKLFLDPLKVDYHVRPRLIQSLEGQGGSSSQKGVVIPLHISGPLDKLEIAVEMDKAALLESAAALNQLSGHKVGGVAGKILDQGFVQTREEEKKKLADKLKKKLAAEKARLQKKVEDKLKKDAEDKLKNALKGFSF
ncbi:MAG: AsmA family protein [Mariprofundaceae bacterium]|nr:AsmA family protein [Mariprofundaceae bacterium]